MLLIQDLQLFSKNKIYPFLISEGISWSKLCLKKITVGNHEILKITPALEVTHLYANTTLNKNSCLLHSTGLLQLKQSGKEKKRSILEGYWKEKDSSEFHWNRDMKQLSSDSSQALISSYL